MCVCVFFWIGAASVINCPRQKKALELHIFKDKHGVSIRANSTTTSNTLFGDHKNLEKPALVLSFGDYLECIAVLFLFIIGFFYK
jgi:hypothetical protein